MNLSLNEKVLNAYKVALQNIKPTFDDAIVQDMQEHIEHYGVTYAPEDIKNETFLEFVAGYFPSDITILEAEQSPDYEFELVYKEESVVHVRVSIKPDDSRTSIVVTDIIVTMVERGV